MDPPDLAATGAIHPGPGKNQGTRAEQRGQTDRKKDFLPRLQRRASEEIGKRAAIIGSGPAGLMAAHELPPKDIP